MWPQIVNAAVGIWLMAAPAVLGYGDPAQTSDRIAGPLAAAFAIIAASEITRPVRWVNLPIGLWLLIVPWVLGFPTVATVNSMIAGVILIVCARLGGGVMGQFGGGWSALWKSQ
jgi:SPW repeat